MPLRKLVVRLLYLGTVLIPLPLVVQGMSSRALLAAMLVRAGAAARMHCISVSLCLRMGLASLGLASGAGRVVRKALAWLVHTVFSCVVVRRGPASGLAGCGFAVLEALFRAEVLAVPAAELGWRRMCVDGCTLGRRETGMLCVGSAQSRTSLRPSLLGLASLHSLLLSLLPSRSVRCVPP